MDQELSAYRGVTFDFPGVTLERLEPWKANILVKGKMVFLGSYETEEDAAHAFDRAALTVAGYGATLNYPLALYTAELPELLALPQQALAMLCDDQRSRKPTSKYRGVSLLRQTGKWRARISASNRAIHLGVFDTEELAAKAYDRASISKGILQGGFPATNFDISTYSEEIKTLVDLGPMALGDFLSSPRCCSGIMRMLVQGFYPQGVSDLTKRTTSSGPGSAPLSPDIVSLLEPLESLKVHDNTSRASPTEGTGITDQDDKASSPIGDQEHLNTTPTDADDSSIPIPLTLLPQTAEDIQQCLLDLHSCPEVLCGLLVPYRWWLDSDSQVVDALVNALSVVGYILGPVVDTGVQFSLCNQQAARWQQAWLWSKLAAVSDSVQGTNSSDAQASGASNAQSSSRDADSEPSSSGASTPVVDLWGKLGYGSACQCKDGSHCKLWMMPQDANSGVSSQPQALTRAHALSVKYEFMCSTENRMGSIDLGLKACHHREQGKSVLCAKLDVFKAAIGILGHCNILVDSAELEVTAFLGLPHTSGHVMSDACRVDSIRVALDDLNPGTAIRIVSEGTAPEACTKKAYRWDLSFGADPEVNVSPGGGGGKVGHFDANRVLEEKQVCPAGKRFVMVACLHGTGNAVRLDRCRTAIEATQQWSDCHKIALDSKVGRGDVVFVMELPVRPCNGVTLIMKPSVRITKYKERKHTLRPAWLHAFNTFTNPSAYELQECTVAVELPSYDEGL